MFNNWLWGSGGEVKSLWSIYVGLHMRYKGRNKEKLLLTLTQNSKNYQSSDCRLKLVYMKSESLVIVNHHVTVNDLSNFAHTAHHARRVVSAGHLSNCYSLYLWILNRTIKIFTWVVIEATRIFYLFTAKEYLLTA
jgi:tryptophan 2,3-dioxygenase